MSRETRYCLAAVAALAGLLLWYSQTRALSWDEGYHLLAAFLVARGKRPYLDFCFPQPPLNAYWNAAWMRMLGETWRVVHVAATLLICGVAWLASGYARTRFPDKAWQGTAALVTLAVVGLNELVVQYGPIGQAYALTLFLIVAAFRLAIKAVDSDGAGAAFLAGLAAGGGACATLLSAPTGVVILIWLLIYNAAGSKWKKAAALIAGEAAAFLPVAWLFMQGPHNTFFNVVSYELLYRQVAWEGALAHDAKVWIAWTGSIHGVLLALLAAGGLLYVKFRSSWTRRERGEYYLCAWLAGVLMIYISQAHPTFTQYYMLAVPFLAILAGAAVYALRARWAAIAVAVIMAGGLAKTVAEEYAYSWPELETLARRVDELAPRDAPIVADEQIYFLTRRLPPSGLELNDSHKLDLGAAEMPVLHLLSEVEVERRIRAGAYALVESCGEYESWEDAAQATYKHKDKVANCQIYW